uniref:ABC transporter B family member 4 n=1 Tax=Lygus hesperus TaxID=30085 RepID=A0A0A9Y4W6_LYGHE
MHSKMLFDSCGSDRKSLMLFPTADHNNFHYIREVIEPIQTFIDTRVITNSHLKLLYVPPRDETTSHEPVSFVDALRSTPSTATTLEDSDTEVRSSAGASNAGGDGGVQQGMRVASTLFEVPASVQEILSQNPHPVTKKLSSMYTLVCGASERVELCGVPFRISPYRETSFNKLPSRTDSESSRARHFCKHSYRSAMIYLNMS